MANERKDKPDLEGEGSYSAAEKYNRELREFEKKEDVGALGRKAMEEVESDEETYRKAEAEGKARMAEEDPELRK